MADRKKDPLTNFHFYVDIESVFAGTFREVSGLTTEKCANPSAVANGSLANSERPPH